MWYIELMSTLVLLRHGQSVWNQQNLFTGWADVDLSDQGVKEAKEAGAKLLAAGFCFDVAFTSLLQRASHTLDIVLAEMKLTGIPIYRSWHLNELHYGALQGLNKALMTAKFGEEQVNIWRRSYSVRPPPLMPSDARVPAKDPLYKDIDPSELPLTESLADTFKRFLPYWQGDIVPLIKAGKHVLIVAHGNSLRALMKHLDNISEEDIAHIELPTGSPYVYELDTSLKPLRSYYLT